MFTTKQQVVDYLVTTGKQRNMAQASVTEMFDYDEKTELLTRGEGDDEMNPGTYTVTGNFEGSLTVAITEQQAINWYNDFMTYNPTVTPEGITFDNELVYDLNGFYLPH